MFVLQLIPYIKTFKMKLELIDKYLVNVTLGKFTNVTLKSKLKYILFYRVIPK